MILAHMFVLSHKHSAALRSLHTNSEFARPINYLLFKNLEANATLNNCRKILHSENNDTVAA